MKRKSEKIRQPRRNRKPFQPIAHKVVRHFNDSHREGINKIFGIDLGEKFFEELEYTTRLFIGECRNGDKPTLTETKKQLQTVHKKARELSDVLIQLDDQTRAELGWNLIEYIENRLIWLSPWAECLANKIPEEEGKQGNKANGADDAFNSYLYRLNELHIRALGVKPKTRQGRLLPFVKYCLKSIEIKKYTDAEYTDDALKKRILRMMNAHKK